MGDASSSRRIIFKGRKIDLALQTLRLSNGKTAEREVVLHRGAVALVPMVDRERVCLVRNDRYSVGKTLLEVPAGTLDSNESPEQTAARELAEETGYQAGRLTRITEWYVSPGVMNERMYLYLCEDLRPGPPRLEPDERLVSEIVPWDEAVRMAYDGRFEDAKTMLAIMICEHRRRTETSG